MGDPRTRIRGRCALCGNGGGGYGAWIGNAAFGTAGQSYADWDASTLYSPVFDANENVTLRFDVAYRTEASYDAGIVQYRISPGPWVTLPYTTPPQTAMAYAGSCNSLSMGVVSWSGAGTSWTTTNAATVPTTLGDQVQFRWRLGSDSVGIGGFTYAGYGVDNVTVTGLATLVCEPTRNGGLPSCTACSAPSGLIANTAVDPDPVLDAGVSVAWAEDAGDWGDGGSGARSCDVLRDDTPIALGVAYDTTTHVDTTGTNGRSYTYAVRYRNGCGLTATTSGVSATDWADPGETAGGTGLANMLVWSAKTTLTWAANANAALYKLYRGGKADLPRLLTADVDSCLRYTGAAATATGLSDNPSSGELQWFLVVAVNGGGGAGGAGFSNFGPRVVNSPAVCP